MVRKGNLAIFVTSQLGAHTYLINLYLHEFISVTRIKLLHGIILEHLFPPYDIIIILL